MISGEARLFKACICDNVCKLCNNLIDNSFCRILFINNKEEFVKLLRCIAILNKLNDKRLLMLRTFEAFSAIICEGICTQRTNSCLSLKNRLVCYEAFLNQNSEKLNENVKSRIYEMYNGINLQLIGTNYKLNILQTLQQRLKKKDRKDIKKNVNQFVKKLKKGAININTAQSVSNNFTNSTTTINSAPVISSTIFFNDNEKWKERLEEMLACDLD